MYQCICKKKFTHKISLNGHQGRCEIHRKWIDDILTPEFLFNEYIINKKSTPDISKETNISIATIHRRLKVLNISRTVKESCFIGFKEKRRKATCIKKYGVPHNFCKNHPSRIKWEQRLKKEEGIVNVFQREKVKEKIKETLLNKYNVETAGCITTSRGKNSYSKLHQEVVKELQKLNIEIFIEKKIPKNNGYYYSFDILIKPKLLIEVNGDYWHGNPNIYKPTDLIMKDSSAEITVQEVWERDKIKLQTAKTYDYNVLIIWEKDWKINKELQIQRIINEIQNCKNRKDKKAR